MTTREEVTLDMLVIFVWHRPFSDYSEACLPILQFYVSDLDTACKQLVDYAGDEFSEGQVIAWIMVERNGVSRSGWARVVPFQPHPKWTLDTGEIVATSSGGKVLPFKRQGTPHRENGRTL